MLRKILLICALILSWPPPAETARGDRQEQRSLRREGRRLLERVDLAWKAVRWQDPQTLASLLEDPSQRLQFLSTHSASSRSYRSVEILGVDIGPAQADGARQATVLVQVQVFDNNELVLRTELLRQGWVLHQGLWWIVPGEELGVQVKGPD